MWNLKASPLKFSKTPPIGWVPIQRASRLVTTRKHLRSNPPWGGVASQVFSGWMGWCPIQPIGGGRLSRRASLRTKTFFICQGSVFEKIYSPPIPYSLR